MRKSPLAAAGIAGALIVGLFLLHRARPPGSTPPELIVQRTAEIRVPITDSPIPLRETRLATRLESMPARSSEPETATSLITEDALLAGIVDALAPEGGELRDHAINELLAALAERNPSAAARFAETNENPGSREEVIRQVARVWSEKDFESALIWAESKFSGEERRAALDEVCKQRVLTHPADVLRLREQFVDSDEPYSAVADLASKWAERDPIEALKWVDGHAPDPRMDEVMARVVFEYARAHPEKAARYVVESIKPGAAQSEAAITVLHQWALVDLSNAARWAESFPEGQLRDRALLEIGGIASDSHKKQAE